MLDPCRVNITTFFERSRCKLRCVVRRGEDDCFMCNRTCNGIYSNFNNIIYSVAITLTFHNDSVVVVY